MKLALLALALLVVRPAQAQSTVGAFSVDHGPDPFTHAPVVWAATPSHEDGAFVSLTWRCTPEPEVVLAFLRMQVVGDAASGAADRIAVQWWFDGGERKEVAWQVASGGQRLVLPTAELPAFSDAARASEHAFVRFEGSPGSGPTYTFDLAGAADALARLPCGAGRGGR